MINDNSIHNSLLREIGGFFGIPAFRLNLNTNIVGFLEADEVDLKEILWIMEDKYNVKLDFQSLQNNGIITIANILEAIEHYKLNYKGGKLTMEKLLMDKVAVVTGASTGIGREIALIFAREGATIALIGRREDELKKTKKMVEELGAKAEVFIADLQTEASLVGERIIAQYPNVNIIVK